MHVPHFYKITVSTEVNFSLYFKNHIFGSFIVDLEMKRKTKIKYMTNKSLYKYIFTK